MHQFLLEASPHARVKDTLAFVCPHIFGVSSGFNCLNFLRVVRESFGGPQNG